MKQKINMKQQNPQVTGPPSQTLSRKEKRKAERKMKKARKDAFAQRKFDLVENLKDIDAEYKQQSEEQKKINVKERKKKSKSEKKKMKKEAKLKNVQAAEEQCEEDEWELRRLEKKLKLNKRGKSTLPKSFTEDGLDYLLDATESDKIKQFDDIASGMPGLSDSESDFDVEDSAEESTNPDVIPTWDPESKVGKSILKNVNKKDKDKRVTFIGAKEESEESDSDSDDDSLGLIGEDEIDDDNQEMFSDDDNDDDGMDDDDVYDDHSLVGQQQSNKNVTSKKGKNLEEIQIMKTEENITSKKRKKSEEKEELKEDIYGRLKDKEGNIVKSTYIPPAKRAMMAGQKPNEALHKVLKGLINRVSEGTIQTLSNQVETLYLENSRADVNGALCGLVLEAVIGPSLTPDRLVAELAMLIAILHSNVGSEVGAFFLQKLAVRFKELSGLPDYGIGKRMDNVLLLISNLYNFKIVSSTIMIDIIGKLIDKFGARDIELLLLLFKTIGFTLRKDDPVQLKQVIMDIQTKARESKVEAEEGMESRVKFMLEIITAIRNNNMRKIPGYDPTHLERLRKLIKSFLRGQVLGDNVLTIALDDLLRADQFGRWWIVGSAWEGRTAKEDGLKDEKAKSKSVEMSGMSENMLKIAKQQGMNTDVRRQIFCILGTSEDFEDAFARLIRLGLNRSQEREIIHVLFHCCLNEKAYNPFYGCLSEKFCTFDRRFMVTIQFTLWDKFKEVDTIGKESRIKLGHLLSHLILSKALSISILKVVEFGMESKKMIRLLVQILSEILSSPNIGAITEIFERIAPFAKLKPLCQGLQVFMRVHLKGSVIKGISSTALQERLEKVEGAMFSHQSMML